MAGNVWQWTKDWYVAGHPQDPDRPCCAPRNPRGAAKAQSYNPAAPDPRVARKVIKGGSYLMRAQLLPALPSGGALSAGDGHHHQPHRLPLRAAHHLAARLEPVTQEDIAPGPRPDLMRCYDDRSGGIPL